MKQLSKYLEDIAVAVLEPIGYLYIHVGATQGSVGYGGVHSRPADHDMWKKWTPICSLTVVETTDGYTIGATYTDEPAVHYTLVWAAHDGIQGSWWVKR